MTCPDCGATFERRDVEQPSLLPDGDTTVTAYTTCPRCGRTGHYTLAPQESPT